MALIAYWDPKAKEVRILCTDHMPAVALFSRVEEDNIIQARERTEKTGKLRAQFYVNTLKVPELANAIELAKVERKMKEALANHPLAQWYVDSQGYAPSGDQAEHTTAQDISADFARKP